jgi:hypothetical protein
VPKKREIGHFYQLRADAAMGGVYAQPSKGGLEERVSQPKFSIKRMLIWAGLRGQKTPQKAKFDQNLVKSRVYGQVWPNPSGKSNTKSTWPAKSDLPPGTPP